VSEEDIETPVRTADVDVEIRSNHLPKTNVEKYLRLRVALRSVSYAKYRLSYTHLFYLSNLMQNLIQTLKRGYPRCVLFLSE